MSLIVRLGEFVESAKVQKLITWLIVINAAILFGWGYTVARLHGIAPHYALAIGATACALGAVLVLLKLALH